jgi:hypothetical protein
MYREEIPGSQADDGVLVYIVPPRGHSSSSAEHHEATTVASQ